MTNKDAIKVLEMIEAHGSLAIQAKDKAIKALEMVDSYPKMVLEALLDSYWYNYEKEYLIDACEDVKNRLRQGNYRIPNEAAHIINGFLTCLYGDYGTSPRYGWIENKDYIPQFIEVLDEFIKECKDVIEEDSEEDG